MGMTYIPMHTTEDTVTLILGHLMSESCLTPERLNIIFFEIITKMSLYCCYLSAKGQMSGDNPVLPEGRHNYPFRFQLPPTLPSSFEGAHGRVRYYLKATIDKPWKFDHTVKRPFTINSSVDLNQMPETRVGVQNI